MISKKFIDNDKKQKMSRHSFFLLLRFALWKNLFRFPVMNKEEWQEILKISKEQTVIGNLADAITTLPIESRPPAKVMQQLVPLVLHIEQQHYRMEQTLVDLFKALNQINVHPILNIVSVATSTCSLSRTKT